MSDTWGQQQQLSCYKLGKVLLWHEETARSVEEALKVPCACPTNTQTHAALEALNLCRASRSVLDLDHLHAAAAPRLACRLAKSMAGKTHTSLVPVKWLQQALTALCNGLCSIVLGEGARWAGGHHGAHKQPSSCAKVTSAAVVAQ